LPIVLSYGPLLISISALWMQPVTGVAPGAINALLTAGSMLVMYWQPVLNPVITFATIAPYRRALLRLVWCRCLSSTPITATNEIVLTTPIVLSPAIQSSSPITTGPRGGSSFLQQQRRSPGRAPYNKQFADNLFTITNNNNNNDGRNNRHTTRNFQTTNNTTLLAFSSTPTLVQQMGIDIDTATRRTAYMSRF
jgi:hypothetical protein